MDINRFQKYGNWAMKLKHENQYEFCNCYSKLTYWLTYERGNFTFKISLKTRPEKPTIFNLNYLKLRAKKPFIPNVNEVI